MRKVIVGTFLTLDGVEGMASYDGFLMGRTTYEIMAPFFPSQPSDDPCAAQTNNLSKYVVSTTLEEPREWSNSTLLKGGVETEIPKLKQQGGKDPQVIGSGEPAHSLMQHDLVDEYRLMVLPVVRGSGKRLFKEGGTKIPLRLIDSKTSSTGVLILTYEPAR